MTYPATKFEVAIRLTPIRSIRRRYIYKKIHCLIFELDLGVKVTQNAAQYPLHHVTYPATKFEVAIRLTPIRSIRRRYIYKKIHCLIFELDLGVKVTQNAAQYPLHHVTYSATKFEVDTSKGLGGDAFTRKFNI